MENKPAEIAPDQETGVGTPIPALSYMPQLDGLRAVAISMVLIGHFHSAAPAFAIPLAWLGVHLFFVLSGFLITRIILVQKLEIEAGVLQKKEAIRTFFIRRVLRLFPLYYTVIALALLLDVNLGRESWAYLVFYLTNLKMALIGGFLGDFSHLWSLAAEEQFYLLWPWLIIFLRARYLPWMLGLVILSGLAFRTFIFMTGHSIFYNNLIFGVCDALGMGALLAVVSMLPSSNLYQSKFKALFFRALPVIAMAGSVAALWLFLTVNWKGGIFNIWATFLVGLPFTWVVWRASSGFNGLIGKLLLSRPAIYLGKISYGVYVIHAFVPSLLISMNIHPGQLPAGIEAWALLIIATTIAIASVSWFVLERPANRLKTRFRY